MTKRIARSLALIMTLSVLMTVLLAGGASADTIVLTKGQTHSFSQVTVNGSSYNITGLKSNSATSVVTASFSNSRVNLTANAVGTATLVVYYTGSTGTAETSVTVTVSNSSGTQSNRQISLSSLTDYYVTPEKFTSVWSTNWTDATVATYNWSGNGNAMTITPLKVGSTVFSFWAQTTDGTQTLYSFTVTVGGSSGTSKTLDTVTLKVGETHYISPESSTFYMAGNNSSNIAKMEKSSDGRVLITAVAAGTTSLSYSYYSGATAYNVVVPVTVTGTTNPSSQAVTLAVGQSYNLNFTTVGISSNSNSAVATAKITSVTGGQQLVVTGVSAGTTTITLVYTSSSGSGTLTLTVTVSGSSGSSTVNSESSGIYFKSLSVSIPTGKKYRISGIKLNGSAINASSLLWISSDTSVMSVNATTGIFQGKKAGSARLIAVDTEGKYVNSIAVTVKSS